VQKFKKDTGVFPNALTDLIARDENHVSVKVKPGTYNGPYLAGSDGINGTAIPKNPLVVADDTNIDHHWTYDRNTGMVNGAQDHLDPAWQ
jgi:hypothetical protein